MRYRQTDMDSWVFVTACAIALGALAIAGCGGEVAGDGPNNSSAEVAVDNGVKFNGVKFNGVKFNGVKFNGVKFNGVKFNGIQFNGIQFNGTSLDGTTLSGTHLSGTAFVG